MNEFEVWLMDELNREYARALTEEIDRVLIGDGSGEPFGVMDETGARMYRVTAGGPWTCRSGVWRQW